MKCPDCGAPLKPGDKKCPVCLKEIDVIVIEERAVPPVPVPPPVHGAPVPPKKQAQSKPAEKKGGGASVPPTAAPATPAKEKSGSGNLVLWIIAGVLAILLVGACIWFFVFYTDRAKGSAGDFDADDLAEGVELVDGELVVGSKVKNTPDLTYNELKGPVKFVTKYTDYGYGPYKEGELFFTKKGEWLNVPIWQGDEKTYFPAQENKFERDASGYISTLYELDGEGEEGGSPGTMTMTWADGRLVKTVFETKENGPDYWYNSSKVTDYTYDDKGNITKASSSINWSSSWGSSYSTEDKSYSYMSFDDEGNWTSRQVSERSRYEDGDPYTNTYTERREIFYY